MDETSVAVSPLLRKIRLFKERKSKLAKSNIVEEDYCTTTNSSPSNNSSIPATPQRGSRSVVLRRKRSKTVSPMKFPPNKKSPRLRRLAASLHLPHYRKHANITVSATVTTSTNEFDWAASRSASLPCKFTYRSPSIVGSLAQQYVLEYCPTFDGFTRSLVDKNRKHCQNILKYDGDQEARNTLAKSKENRQIYHRNNRRAASPEFQRTVAVSQNCLESKDGAVAVSRYRSRAVSCDRSADKTAGYSMTASTPGGGVHDKMKQVLGRRLSAFSGKLLTNDKSGGLNSYTLKDKIKLCQLWVTSDTKYIDSIADYVKNVSNSFTIGWTTKNYVAEFNSLEERNSWFNILDSRIADELVRKNPQAKSAYASVQYKTRKTCITRKIALTNGQHVDDLLQIALMKFNLHIEGAKTSNAFQLWAQFGKENQQIRLHGYERPLAILKAHIRDLLEIDDEIDADAFVYDESFEFGLTFLLKQRRPPKLAKTKRTGAGQLVIQLKNRVRHNRHGDPLIEPQASSSRESQAGKLFGIPLDSFDPFRSAETKFPEEIQAIMERIFKGGLYVEGIFRKSPNHRIFREIRDKLDNGFKVDFNDVQPCVCASLLKEFLRLLPDSLLTSEVLPEWMSTMSNDSISLESKVVIARKLISQMPDANCQLLRRLLCLFYHIKNNEWANHMNSHSLSICLAPSLIGSAVTTSASNTSPADFVDLQTRQASEIIKFFIENVVELFGFDTLSLFGDVPDRPNSNKRDSSEESDSIGANFRRPAGSLDSLIMETSSPDGSRPQSAFRNVNSNPTSMNLSRDSGLSDLHASVEDVAEQRHQQRGFLERVSMPPNRSISQSDDANDIVVHHSPSSTFYDIADQVTKSVDNLISAPSSNSCITGDTSTTTTTTKSATLDGRHGSRLRDDLMSRSWHVGIKNVASSESSDSLYESLESNCSFVDATPVAPQRKSESVSGIKQPTLIRSASGERLISIVINRAPTGDLENKTKSSANKFRAVVNDEDDADETTIVATSAPTTRSSSSPSPISFMDRYSAIRKPARHRKCQAPSPPQLKKNSYDGSLDSRSSSITQGSIADSQDSTRSSLSQQSVPTLSDDSQAVHRSVSNARSQWLSTKVALSLNEIRDQVKQASQQVGLLPNARFGDLLNGDSSTLTDTSSEDRTPRVSREGSRASRDCCRERSEIRANLRTISATIVPNAGNSATSSSSAALNNKNLASVSSNNKRLSQSVIEDELFNARRAVGVSLQRQRPPSYHKAVQQKQQPSLPTVENILADSKLPERANPLSNSSSFAYGSSCVGSKFDYSKPPLARTPGGGVVLRHPTVAAAAGMRTKDISWSVKEKVDLFQRNPETTNRTSTCESTNEHNTLKNNNSNVRVGRSRTKLGSDTDRPRSSDAVDQLMTASCYGDAALATIRFSDSYANYPVVRPPPLTTRLSLLSTSRHPPANRYSSPTGYRNTGGQHQHRSNYRSVSVHHVDRKPLASSMGRSVDTESYV